MNLRHNWKFLVSKWVIASILYVIFSGMGCVKSHCNDDVISGIYSAPPVSNLFKRDSILCVHNQTETIKFLRVGDSSTSNKAGVCDYNCRMGSGCSLYYMVNEHHGYFFSDSFSLTQSCLMLDSKESTRQYNEVFKKLIIYNFNNYSEIYYKTDHNDYKETSKTNLGPETILGRNYTQITGITSIDNKYTFCFNGDSLIRIYSLFSPDTFDFKY